MTYTVDVSAHTDRIRVAHMLEHYLKILVESKGIQFNLLHIESVQERCGNAEGDGVNEVRQFNLKYHALLLKELA